MKPEDTFNVLSDTVPRQPIVDALKRVEWEYDDLLAEFGIKLEQGDPEALGAPLDNLRVNLRYLTGVKVGLKMALRGSE